MTLSEDLEHLSPEERIKRLREIEKQKKSELEKKKKELEELEKKAKEEEEQHQKDIDEANRLIIASIQDLHKEEEKAFEELEKAKKQDENEEFSLEMLVEEQHPVQGKADVYGAILEGMKGELGFYQITNYNTVNAVQHLAHKSLYEKLSFQERQSLDNLKHNLGRMDNNTYYAKKDSSNYLEKLNQAINEINKNLQEKSEEEKKKEEELRQRMLYQ